MLPSSPSITRRRKFCTKRHPYNTHLNVDFSPFLRSLDEGKSIRTVAKTSNINRSSLHRMYKEWVAAERPATWVMVEKRGRKPTLTIEQEVELCVQIDSHIADERVLQFGHVKSFAKSIHEQYAAHLLRS
jgi:hypothetical protein